MLTAKKIDAAKAMSTQYKLHDAQGLYLFITPRGVKSWRCNYRLDGKNKTKVFGQYPDIGLAQARLLNVEFKDAMAEGTLKPELTFDQVKAKWYAHHIPELKNAKHKQQVQYRLDTFASPYIGSKGISTIKRADLVDIVHRVQDRETKTVDTAHRVAFHLGQIFDYAVDIGVLELHPAGRLSRVLRSPVSTPMPCVSVGGAAALLKAINAQKDPMARYGLLFMCLTFVRTSEFRFMEMSEIVDECFWVIPEGRMKMRKPHVVPLSPFALRTLAALRAHTGETRYVMQSKVVDKKPVSENFFLDALERLGYKGVMTGHGFRALASTVLNGSSPFAPDVIERQLAHGEKDAVRAAYNRAEHLEERVKLMAWYSDWVQAQLSSAICV